eukprot:6460461-Amphidinium_carterae.1
MKHDTQTLSLHVTSEPSLDTVASGFGYNIESVTTTPKNCKARAFRGIGVPLVGLALGVFGAGWADAWLALRRKLGLQVGIQGTLNPMTDDLGAWSKTSYPSWPAARALRDILNKHG